MDTEKYVPTLPDKIVKETYTKFLTIENYPSSSYMALLLQRQHQLFPFFYLAANHSETPKSAIISGLFICDSFSENDSLPTITEDTIYTLNDQIPDQKKLGQFIQKYENENSLLLEGAMKLLDKKELYPELPVLIYRIIELQYQSNKRNLKN